VATIRKPLIAAAAAALLLSVYFYSQQLYVALSYALWCLFFIAVLAVVDRRRLTAEEAVLIAALSAIAAVGRTIFAPIPSVQPVSFIIICAAAIFGWRTGLLIGILSAFVSNLFLGQGPWTLWQMLAWGMMGVFAGLLFHSMKIRSKKIKMVFGFFAGILFGWFMNLWYLVSYVKTVSMAGILLAYSASAYMDLMHGLANVFFIAVFSASLEKILERVKTKYGILSDA
jgi:energy-coupling factor transport system substrate-specific component